MPRQSQPSGSSGYRIRRSRAAASASLSLPTWTSSTTAWEASAISSSSSCHTSLLVTASLGSWMSRQRAAASSAPFSASSLGRQHFLYFLPLPQGQGSLRPELAILVRTLKHGEGAHLYATLLADATFHDFLLACDQDLAAQARRRGCRFCRGALHSGDYRRKPRGRLCRLGPEHDWRFSLCCARHGCRTRKTPPSLRFLGPKVYVAAALILIALLHEGVTPTRMQRLKELIGVDGRSLERWRRWWREVFTAMPFWQAARAAFMPPVDEAQLPAAMLERFAGDAAEQMTGFLRFLAPITGGQVQAL